MTKPKTRPRHIAMFAFEGAQVLDVTGPMQILAAVNDEMPDAPPYTLSLHAKKAGPFGTSGGIRLVADADYKHLPRSIDTLIVSGGFGVEAAMKDRDLMAAIKSAAKRARRVVSVCTGAFLLAEAGLLRGKRATTHWRSAKLLARAHPEIAVEPDAIFVRDGQVWSSAGVTAGMDLALALVREDFGDDMALTIARRHVLFLVRPGGQSQFSAHLSADAYPVQRLSGLLKWIPENLTGDLDVETLASRANMSPRNFARLFQKETGVTPAAYVERARLDAARRLLTASALPVETVAMRAGFGSEERMRRTFHRHLRISPAAFRERFAMNGERP